MSKLSLLKKNAYLTIVVKDDAIWSHLAYVDYNNDVQYILSDYTDISHFHKRLDDHLFMGTFWSEYFRLLEKLFGWELIQNTEGGLSRMVDFKDENHGVNGIKILVDDNQQFLTNIFHSISHYSHDIAVRVIDTPNMRKLIGKLSEKLGYEDMIYIDLDINSFQIYRVQREGKQTDDTKLPNKYKYSEAQQYWSNRIGIIDAIKDRRLHAFMASDINNAQLENSWANLIMHPVDVLLDQNLKDILRSFTTVQLFSLLSDNRRKLEGIGSGETKTLIAIGGKIPRLLGKKATLLSIIDGLELYGTFDVIWDNECKIQAYGMSTAMGSQSSDIIIGRNDVISAITKVLIPELKSKKAIDKVIFSATYKSQDFEPETVIVLGDTFEMIKIKNKVNKVVFEGKLEDNVYLPALEDRAVNFISSPLGVRYENILIDSRLRPIVYGMDSYSNKLKINKWINDN
ncbi:hypothetical protein K8R14_03260 [bacterium]|nr:hypothetical protein [bacterium]